VADHLQIPTAAGRFDALTTGPEGGRAVLFLHGFPEAGLQWTAQLSVLGGANCHAVAVDQRGYSPGVRPEAVAEYRLEELVGDVVAIADHLGWQRFDLVGHDWGAVVAWATAAIHPQRLRTLTAVSVPHPDAYAKALREDPDQQQRSAYIRVFRSSGAERTLLANNAEKLRRIYDFKIPERHVTEYVQRFTEPGALTAALNWYRAAAFGTVGPVSVPTLYVWSTDDVAIGSTGALACGDHVTGPYRFEVLEDVSHWIPEEAPELLSRLLLEHLLAHQD
jgi:pimeloyl-ACP methyl ester carboxylesterase